MLVKYFTQNGEKWQIRKTSRKMVQFGIPSKLLHENGPISTFDIIFCRNVRSHFLSNPSGSALSTALAAFCWHRDGFLIVDSDEYRPRPY